MGRGGETVDRADVFLLRLKQRTSHGRRLHPRRLVDEQKHPITLAQRQDAEVIGQRLRDADDQIAAGRQQRLEPLQHPPSGRLIEIDRDIAKEDHVLTGQRLGIVGGEQVERLETHPSAQTLIDPEMIGVDGTEIALLELRTQRTERETPIDPGTRTLQHRAIDVPGVDLEETLGQLAIALAQGHQDRIGFLAGRAADRQQPHRRIGGATRQQLGTDPLGQQPQMLGFAIEVGLVDGDETGERVQLGLIVAQPRQIVLGRAGADGVEALDEQLAPEIIAIGAGIQPQMLADEVLDGFEIHGAVPARRHRAPAISSSGSTRPMAPARMASRFMPKMIELASS